MRFRTFELVRYGGYADRKIEFGDGKPDLHLFVGPNEAGKSTLLAAMADFLFGIHPQSPMNWRYDYSELRLRAEVRSDGEELRAVRRKGTKNTLLAEDGSPLDDSVLARLIGDVDRASFDRMYGLDHTKLRDGGIAIVTGKDDAARTLFEAGTGLSAVGAELKHLEAETTELFAPSAQRPRINTLLRKLGDARSRVRDNSLSEKTLREYQESQRVITDRRAILGTEGEQLSTRRSLIERVNRTRLPLARLTAARALLSTLGEIPPLPPDANTRLALARQKRTDAQEQKADGEVDLAKAVSLINGVNLPIGLLAQETEIRNLELKLSEIEKAGVDLIRRETELETFNAELLAARIDGGLGPDRPWPDAAWRQRCRFHLEAARAVASRQENYATAQSEFEADSETFERESRVAGSIHDTKRLKAAMDQLPPNAEDQQKGAALKAQRERRRADAAIAGLAWIHGVEALEQAALPSPQEAGELQTRVANAQSALKTADDQLKDAEADLLATILRLKELSAGGDVPTVEALLSARASRTEALDDVLERLGSDRGEGDVAAGATLTNRIGDADTLADRRQSESERLATHVHLSTVLATAEAKITTAKAEAAKQTEELDAANLVWRGWKRAGRLPEALLLTGMEPWRTARASALQLCTEAENAELDSSTLQSTLVAAHEEIGAAIKALGQKAPDGYVERRRQATEILDQLDAANRALEQLTVRKADLDRRLRELDKEAKSIREKSKQLEAEKSKLADAAGLATDDVVALDTALTATESAVADQVKADGLERQIAGIKRDIEAFTARVDRLSHALSLKAQTKPVETVRALAIDIGAALELKRKLETAKAVKDGAVKQIEVADTQINTADELIAHLIELAGVDLEAEMDGKIEQSQQGEEALKDQKKALEDLLKLGDGLSLEKLQEDAQTLTPDEAAAGLESISVRRRELDGDLETVGRELAEVNQRLDATARTEAAAEAQQDVNDLQAELVSAAERYVGVAAQAALLKWLIERHRATNQAPLLARAGEIFTEITDGEYPKVILDYDDDDKPRIVALRSDGSKVEVSGLSEGARDQFYLSLRLASLLIRAGGVRLPLICDDLLVSSDNTRAAEVLRALKHASGEMQVLVFTHHDHLIPVAERVIGSDAFILHRLSPVKVAVAA